VVHLCETHGVSHATALAGDCKAICREGRACDVLQIDRSTVRYLSRRGDNIDLRDAIKRVSRERRRFGCPLPGNRYVVSMRGAHSRDDCARGLRGEPQEGKAFYRKEKLQVRRRGGRKCALGTRKLMVLPDGPYQRPLSVIACNHLPVSGNLGFCI
jgi:putative transposase